jgi:3-oxoacyl-[acyl-carrier protein] reductase
VTQTIVVTGATGETGRAVCAALLAAGNTVIAVGSDAGRLETVEASARIVADLTDVASAADLAASVAEISGSLDGLVHLVGGWRPGHDNVDWQWLEPRLVTSLRLATLAFHDALTASRSGRLVVIGSAVSAKPTWSGANYGTLKATADAWVAAVASGWRKAGTAAAVTLVVKSIGPDGTPVDDLVQAILPLWDTPAAELNGTRIDLSNE